MINTNNRLQEVEAKEKALDGEEVKLEKEIKDFKKKEETWGEKPGEEHVINMEPLKPHHSVFGDRGHMKAIYHKLANLGHRFSHHVKKGYGDLRARFFGGTVSKSDLDK